MQRSSTRRRGQSALRPYALGAALLSAALLAAACGGGGSDNKKVASGPTAEDSTAANPAPAPDAANQAPVTPAAPDAAATPADPGASAGAKPSTPAAPKTAAGTKTGSATNTPVAKPSTAASPDPKSGSPSAPAPTTPGAPDTGISGAPAPAGGNGGATDVGVSETGIKFGSISGNNTPLGNLISVPVTTAVFASMRAVNDAGGIFGRKMNIQDCDDAGDVTRFRACYKKLVEQEKIFSFATSVTWGTGEVHGDLARDKIPWIGSWGFYTSEWKDPWMFPAHMASVHEAHADAVWVRDVLKPKKVGVLYLNSPEQKVALAAIHQVLDKAGIKVAREIPQEIDTPDESSNVLSMRAAEVEHIIHFSWPPPVVKFMVDAAQQNYWPSMGMSGNHFLGEQIGRLVGDWPLQNMWTISTYKLWGEEYLATMDKYAPQMRKLNHHITQTGFIGIKLLADAAKELGPNLTRTGLMKVLESKKWDMGPGLGQSVFWGAGNHDTMRCEYMFRYNNTDTGSQKVYVPDPKKFEICDDVD